MTKMNTVRPRLDRYVDTMRAKLALPQNQRKSDWRKIDPEELVRQVGVEVVELSVVCREYLAGHSSLNEVLSEAADVGNRAMMVSDRVRLMNRRQKPR